MDLVRLLPGTPSADFVFIVDDAEYVTVELTSSIELTSTTIALPESGTITPENIGMEYGGSFRGFSVGSNPLPECYVLPYLCEPGHHYLFEFPSQGPGEYTLSFSAPVGLGGESDAGVLVRILTDSPIAIATVAAPAFAKVDSAVTIAVPVFDGDSAVASATVVARIREEGESTYSALTLLDDGEDADAEADDGIYSGVYTPTEVGNYEVAVSVTGTSRSFDFERHSGSSFTVYDPPAEFSTPLAVSDAGMDTDDPANGLYNRLDIGVEVDVHQAGNYILTAVLEAADESVLFDGVHPTDAITALMTRPLRAE